MTTVGETEKSSPPQYSDVVGEGGGDVEPSKDDGRPERETWSNKVDFLLALVGFSVGLGNVWRFPYLCYKNGGGAFLLPYFMCVLIGGVPLLYLEISLGQFMSKGGAEAWLICPLLQGLGWCSASIVFFVNCYYQVILAWSFYYMFASFTSELPWETCDNYWNTPQCVVDHLSSNNTNATLYDNFTLDGNSTENATLRIGSVTEFWENKVLGLSDGIENVGTVKWDLCLCLLLSWIVVFLCIWKGVKSSGKVVYFTATAPYVFLLILLIRGYTLPGAIDGLKFYMVPDFSRLMDLEVWVDAGTQVFFSYAIGIAGLTALGSYNQFNHNSFRDSIIFAATNSGTSIFAGFVVFAMLGFMAHEQGVSVKDVAESGPGLAFIAYPKAVSVMPISPLWSVLFFFMLILLGLDSQFVGVEGLITAIVDSFPFLRKGNRKVLFTAFAVFIHFLMGLPMVTNGGMYVFQLFDYYPGSRIVVLVGLIECIAIAYIYGVNRYYDNIEMMLGFRIGPWMKICWVALTPAYCALLFIMSAVSYSNLTYERPSGIYTYPDWAVGVGWSLAGVTVILIPIMTIYNVYQFVSAGKPLADIIKPQGLLAHQLRPQDQPYEGVRNGPEVQWSKAAMADTTML